MTPSDHSDAEHDDDSDSDRDDSDYQSEDGTDDSSEGDVDKPNIKWTGYNKKVPVIMFHSEAVLQNVSKYKKVGERFHMGFKFGSTESRIIRTVLLAHGFHEVSSNNSDFNMLWTGGHLKPLTLRNMSEFQKINHFPRSYELTRKDRLYKNVQRMQQIKGSRNFNFVPMSFVIPAEYQEFCAAFSRDKGPWIIKPVASSRGRGVHLVNHPDQVPLEENLIISRYIQNPLLIDGFKFDVRLYVAVTSYDPLVIYLYEEGLTRFATVRYEKSNRNLRNQCMHLTNYSVNKKSNGYVKNDDPDIEDYGNKWSLGALLRYLKRLGTDTAALMMKIEDVIVKTILSAELHIAAATKMFVNNKWNCFELYGFDILIDDTMKPWILEVNLSPSLVCDSPLDLKIKTNLVCDLFSAIGIVCHDPILKNYQQTRKNREFAAQMNCGRKRRPASAGASTSSSHGNRTSYFRRGMSGLNSEEIKIVRRIKEEEARKGGWVRLFPSPDSWDLYSPFLQFATTHNLMLHQRLYPHRHKTMMYKCLSPVTSLGSRAKMVYNNLANSVSNLSKFENENCESFVQAQRRALQYERKLEERRVRPRKARRGRSRRAKKSKSPSEAITSHAILADKVATTSSSSPTKPFFYSSLDGLDKVSSSYCTLSRTCPSPIAGMSAYSSQAPSETLLDYSKNKALTSQIDAALQKVDIIEILENGGNLSQLQARTAFALYLNKVQQRLLKEATSTEEGNVDSLNDQMDLVLRFLKRAAVNLQRNFRVVVPSKKLPLKERARILAKELAEFVQHYKKETLQLKKTLQNEMKDDITQPISAEDFNRFLQYSNESELEMVLTTYAKLKKSASIFLGESTTASLDDSQSSSISSTSPKEGKVSTNPKKEGTHRGKKNTSPPKNPSDIAFKGEIPPGFHRKPSCHPSTGNVPYTLSGPGQQQKTFVNIYSQKITQSRPSSVINFKPASRIPTQRPASASSSRCLSAATQDISVDTYNERAIQDALQNLVIKAATSPIFCTQRYWNSIQQNL
ncbi:TTLL5 [Acanthosepion pharaonis]|uniref:Tubulin--tyrosine ligase-like protein 5 n=1 Tax=Acanthosepion pharaonis TaxID=158019 RepID=A0A812CLE8_ACAPH|nr:TTLL5 [Sepia pharaonis]